jgi:enamine deaminase RidA (YjgF/YER057c/UK114 family)
MKEQAMEKRRIVLPEIEQFYKGTLHKDIPEYQPIRIAHAIVTKGGNTLRMSGYPAIGPDGIIGKGDMRVQTLQALEYVKRTVEAGRRAVERYRAHDVLLHQPREMASRCDPGAR